jgi:hypothetical protein
MHQNDLQFASLLYGVRAVTNASLMPLRLTKIALKLKQSRSVTLLTPESNLLASTLGALIHT